MFIVLNGCYIGYKNECVPAGRVFGIFNTKQEVEKALEDEAYETYDDVENLDGIHYYIRGIEYKVYNIDINKCIDIKKLANQFK